MATTNQLVEELKTLAEGLREFQDPGFYAFNADEVLSSSESATFPLLVVTYEGSQPAPGNDVSPAGQSRQTAQGVVFVERVFSIVVGVNYNGIYGVGDTKVIATDLLDALRAKILGYVGVGTRPWVWVNDTPVDGYGNGVIYYAQVWKMIEPQRGTDA